MNKINTFEALRKPIVHKCRSCAEFQDRIKTLGANTACRFCSVKYDTVPALSYFIDKWVWDGNTK